jgi:dTDP-4-dehydrorhamnose reductase
MTLTKVQKDFENNDKRVAEGKRRLVVVGASGMLATMVQRLALAKYEVTPLGRPSFDLTNATASMAALREIRPHVIINCAAYTDVDGAETNETLANLVNEVGARNLAVAAKDIGATLVHVSTDYVFDGEKSTPYVESDPPNPRSAYGRSKLLGEEAIKTSGLEQYFIVRTSWLYGAGGKNFVETIIRLALEREELRIVADQVGTPTHTRDLAQAIFNLIDLPQEPGEGTQSPDSPFGIYHFANDGACSWYEFACEIVAQLKKTSALVKVERILPIGTADYPLPAPRPAYSVMSTGQYKEVTGATVPTWQEALAHYIGSRGQ